MVLTIDQHQSITVDRQQAVRHIGHGDCRNSRKREGDHAVPKEERRPVHRLLDTIAKDQAPGSGDEQRKDASIQSVFGLKHSLVAARHPVAKHVDQPSAGVATEYVTDEARDVDEAVDHG